MLMKRLGILGERARTDERTRLAEVLNVIHLGLVEMRAIANVPGANEQCRFLADALHNLPTYVAGRLRGPGRPAIKTGGGIGGSHALHDEFFLGESLELFTRYQERFPALSDYAGRLAAIMPQRTEEVTNDMTADSSSQAENFSVAADTTASASSAPVGSTLDA